MRLAITGAYIQKLRTITSCLGYMVIEDEGILYLISEGRTIGTIDVFSPNILDVNLHVTVARFHDYWEDLMLISDLYDKTFKYELKIVVEG